MSWRLLITCMVASVLGFASMAMANPTSSPTVIFEEDWESGIGGWTDTTLVWEVGVPTSGPGSPHGGSQVAATNLAGTPPVGADARLVSPAIALPLTPTDGHLSFSFYHWFELYSADTTRVQISVDNGPWETVSTHFVRESGAWSRHAIDISSYAGETVRFAFYFKEIGNATWDGSYIDDVEITEGRPAFANPEGFESGIDGWYAERGVWEVGPPSVGPSGAHSGSQVAGTVLGGWFPNLTDSRFISPSVDLTPSPQDSELWFSFYHWFQVFITDTARVQISVDDGPWETISTHFVWESGAWTRHAIDISSYAGQTVRFAFYLTEIGGNPWTGWYIDDVEITEGRPTLANLEGFESGIDGWYAERGVWEVGPPSVGPSGAHSGSQVAGTVLGGWFPDRTDSRFISPSVDLTPSPQDSELWFSFYHWFQVFITDTARVQISVDDGPWETISTHFVWESGAWTRHAIDVSSYAGQTVRFAFYLTEIGGNPWTGWYIDDVEITEGRPTLANLEGFESGIDGWYAERGVWEVGPPSVGPSGAHSGSQVAGTVLGGWFPDRTDSRFISPSVDLTPSPQDSELWFSFYHWFQVYIADTARVQISVDDGPWETISAHFVWESGAWTRHAIDVSSYAGQTVRFAFYLTEIGGNPWTGWYIDDVEITEGAHAWSSPDSYEYAEWGPAVEGGWYAERGVWEVGEPTSGPGSARTGSYCAGSDLGGILPYRSDSRLIGPQITLDSAPLGGKTWLSFYHWFRFFSSDLGRVEISVAGGPWQTISADFDKVGGAWTQHIIDISAYAGQPVRFAFHVMEVGASSWEGWYIDDVAIIYGPKTRNNPEGFESGTRGWYADHGIWELGAPTSGPGSAFSGDRVAATGLSGVPPLGTESRLISPSFDLPVSGPLSVDFQHWHEFFIGDSAHVEISVAEGPWTRISPSYTGTQLSWTPATIDITAHAGESVRFALHYKEVGGSAWSGWYVDDFLIGGLSQGGPSNPQAFNVDYTSGPPSLSWTNPVEPIAYVGVYASSDPDFVPDMGNRIALVDGTSFSDVAHPGWYTHYKITAIDSMWRESELDSPTVTAIGDDGDVGGVPIVTGLFQNSPNPFNPSTTIKFSMTTAGWVTLSVFDVSGRRVATLVDGVIQPGVYDVPFGAKGLATGVYFYRLQAPGVVQTRKMVLLK